MAKVAVLLVVLVVVMCAKAGPLPQFANFPFFPPQFQEMFAKAGNGGDMLTNGGSFVQTWGQGTGGDFKSVAMQTKTLPNGETQVVQLVNDNGNVSKDAFKIPAQ